LKKVMQFMSICKKKSDAIYVTESDRTCKLIAEAVRFYLIYVNLQFIYNHKSMWINFR
jgi:hypothetical protein